MNKPDDLPQELYLAAQTRELDRTVIEEFGVPGLTLMRRAGEAAFSFITSRYSDCGKLVVVCGAGNNGGDGYVVARRAREIGMAVTVIATAEPQTGDARRVYLDYVEAGGSVQDPAQSEAVLADAELLVDALFGTGLNRAPEGEAARLIRAMNLAPCPLIALDIASGLHSDTGEAFDPCIRAQATITFIGLKLGLLTAQGPAHSGEIVFDDLVIPPAAREKVDVAARIIQPPEVGARDRDMHKGGAGRVWVAGGADGMLGAVLMAGETALRCGAGLVTVASTPAHVDLPALHCPALMSMILPANCPVTVPADLDALVLGPGLGMGAWGEHVFDQFSEQDVPMVVDADGLNWLARKPSHRRQRILTPHPGEAARLLQVSVPEVQRDRLAAVRAVQQQYGGTCLLKGPGTLVCGEDGRVFLCDRGNPGMATAGMGDVLSGVLGALLGQGMATEEAARTGAWIHSAAADRLVVRTGERGLVASDLPREIGGMWRELGTARG